MMRLLLAGLASVDNFVDDILIHTETWQEHLQALREVFHRLRSANSTVKPSKCPVGFRSVKFLGHDVGNGLLKPIPCKVSAILNAK